MKEILENISASPRLRRFTASYLLLYFIITLSVNLLQKFVPVINTFAGGYIKDFIVCLIDASMIYGLVRGIVNKNYRIGEAISSFAETENYIHYLIYAAVNTAYSALYSYVSSLTAASSYIATVGWILSVFFILIKFMLNFALVRLYFDKLIYGNKKLNLSEVVKSTAKLISDHPGRIATAEIVFLIAKYVSIIIGTLFVSTFSQGLGSHWAISFSASCLTTVQFGALIYIWPMYYLYYKETCEM